jgi:DNA helicase IV
VHPGLVKGLEYDHVVIANVGQLTDVNNLYVALTRARKSVTIVGTTDTISLT